MKNDRFCGALPPWPTYRLSSAHLEVQNMIQQDSSHYSSFILALILVTAVGLSCRLAKNLTGDPSAGTVSSLWPDVPPLAGATKTDLEIPLGARLAIRAFMQGKINFIAFTTDQRATDVQAFYTNERMK